MARHLPDRRYGELREGVPPATFTPVSEDTILGMPIDIQLGFAAVHVIGRNLRLPRL
jgi:hypothetical protein